MRAAVVSVAAEDDLFAIVTDHGKSIKGAVVADLGKPCAVRIDDIHIERKAPLELVVAAKNDTPVG